MKRKPLFLLLFTLGLVTFFACEKEIDESESDELLRLDAYMSIHYSDAKPISSGLYHIPIESGSGKKVENGHYILFDYTGQNLDDYVFETTHADVALLHEIHKPRINYSPQYKLLSTKNISIIPGMHKGFLQMSEGDSARLIMSSAHAYGENSHSGLSPYSSIIVDIRLKKVVTDPEAFEKEQTENYLAENYSELKIEDIYTDGVYILENELVSNEEEEDEEENEEEYHQEIVDNDIVNIYYTGRLLDGWVFDTNIAAVAIENSMYETGNEYLPLSVEIGSSSFIKGFSLALKQLKTHSKATVILPSEFSYGADGTSTIPPYAPLIFELEILGKRPKTSK